MLTTYNHNNLVNRKKGKIGLFFDIPWYGRNYHIYKEINIPRLNDYIQQLNLHFHLVLENSDESA